MKPQVKRSRVGIWLARTAAVIAAFLCWTAPHPSSLALLLIGLGLLVVFHDD